MQTTLTGRVTEKERSKDGSRVSSSLRWKKLQHSYMMLKDPVEKLMMQEREELMGDIKTLSN